tara:strand:+ start:99 stop:323 length:225 start_codon:yes stop_codon:yes gene_type:complete
MSKTKMDLEDEVRKLFIEIGYDFSDEKIKKITDHFLQLFVISDIIKLSTIDNVKKQLESVFNNSESWDVINKKR